MTFSIAEWRYQSRKLLAEVSETAEIEVNAVICSVLNKNLPWCLTNSNFLLSQEYIKKLDEKFIALMNGFPLPYVLGEIEFFGNHFVINENVLIPRPETELMVETAIAWLNHHEKSEKLVDVGCGSGAIIISILKNFPGLKGFGIDISRGALKIAQNNKKHHHIKNLDFIQMDILNGMSTKFDMIVANLPYIPEDLVENLQVSIYEPRVALNGGKDGLAVIIQLLELIPRCLNKPGVVLLEIQFDQAAPIIQKIQKILPGAVVSVIKDYSNHDRIIRLEV